MSCDLPILAYHKVDSRRELGITSLSPLRFERQIRFLKHKGYASIQPQSLVTRVVNVASLAGSDDLAFPFRCSGGQTPPTFKPVLITFDDGYEGVYTHAYPILKEYAFTAIIFLITGYIGVYNDWDASPGPRFKHLDWTHIREMADDGIWFGSHGVNHNFLTRQSDSAARYEIEASKKKLEDRLGRPIHFFSYPYGDYDERIMGFVREAGYKAAFSLRPELLKAGHTGGSIPVARADVSSSPLGSAEYGDSDSPFSDLAKPNPSRWGMRGRPPPQAKTRSANAGDLPRIALPWVCGSCVPTYALPRIAVYLLDDIWAFKAKVGSVRNGSIPYLQKLKNRLINRCAYASMLVERFRS